MCRVLPYAHGPQETSGRYPTGTTTGWPSVELGSAAASLRRNANAAVSGAGVDVRSGMVEKSLKMTS